MANADPGAPTLVAGGGARRRLGWTIADQAVASAGNLVTAVVAARSLDPEGFGAFGLAFTVYLLAVGASRALVTEPLLVRHSGPAGGTMPARTGQVVGASAGVGLAVAAVLLAASPLLGGAGGQALWAMALVLPGILVQDAWRYCFVAAGRPRSALLVDAVWCLVQAVLLVVLSFTHPFTVVTVVVWWGASGGVAALAGCGVARSIPTPRGSIRWITGHWDLGSRFVAEFLSATGAAHATLLALGATAGLGALGAVRAAMVYFGPVNVVFGGIFLALVPEGARLRDNRPRLRRLMGLASVGLALLTAAWLAVGLVLPQSLGRATFGATWPAARALLLPAAVGLLGGSLAAGGMAGLRALADARRSLRARLLGLPLLVVAPVAGSAAGAGGFAWGLAAGTWVGAAIWRRQFSVALAAPGPPGPALDERG